MEMKVVELILPGIPGNENSRQSLQQGLQIVFPFQAEY